MSTKTITFCDRCNPEQQTNKDAHGRGYVEAPPDAAVSEFDWEIRKGKHVCLDCLDEEDAGKEKP